MSVNLAVNNQIFRYKDTKYQVSLIEEIRPIQKHYRYIEKPIKWKFNLLIAALGLIVISIALLYLRSFEYYEVFIPIILVSIFISFIILKFGKMKEEYQIFMYGFYIGLSGGRRKYFWSSRQDRIKAVHDNILKAINKENVNYSTNINIEVSDSEDTKTIVNIGNKLKN